ncbi:DUF3566 domain-containing protein [Candidatus Pacearchaeota archaeon]|nr:DUF3566 domain-containing protein [Candidatus Pacearchaeota archaeon]
MEIKKVKIWSLAKLSLLFGLITGILTDIILLVLKKVVASSIPLAEIANNPQYQSMAYLQTLSSFNFAGALIIIAEYALIGLVWGLLIAIIYNLLAKYFGGIRIEVAETKK